MGNIGPWELGFILLIAIIFFGPSKIPDIAKGLGKAVNEFKQASSGVQKQFQDVTQVEKIPSPVASSTREDAPLKA